MVDLLTKSAENLLREILDHRNNDGIVDSDFFFKKLDAMNSAEDALYRSCFKELSENDLAITQWADGGPYMITLTSAGIEYFDQKKAAEIEKKEEKKSALKHDILIAGIGAIFGGAVTLVLFLLFGIS
ncbi:MAG: hypothetical protein Q4E99_05605, partial [Bacillota bacterium]|nr:hypothetical protein [Bacillota bacterium]